MPLCYKLKGRNIVEVEVSPSVAMAMTIRQLRLKHELTQVAMIKKAFPDFKVDPLMS